MIQEMGLTRRKVLQLLAWIGLSPLVRNELDPGARAFAAQPVLVHPALRGFRHASAAVVGAEYLRRRPEEADTSKLCRLLALPDPGASWESSGDLTLHAASLVARHRQDFRTGRVLNLEGWTLSITELRLSALLHLST